MEKTGVSPRSTSMHFLILFNTQFNTKYRRTEYPLLLSDYCALIPIQQIQQYFMKPAKTPSVKCFDGKIPLSKHKQVSKTKKPHRDLENSKLKRPASNYKSEFPTTNINHQPNHLYTEVQHSEDWRMAPQSTQQRFTEKECQGCKELFPAALIESHKNVCEMMLFISEKKNKKKATEEKRQVSKKSKIRRQSKSKNNVELIRKKQVIRPNQPREDIRKDARKKVVNYQNQLQECLRNHEGRMGHSVRRQQNKRQPQVQRQPRPNSNRPRRQRTVQDRRGVSQSRINGMFPTNIFQQINFGGFHIPQINELLEIGNEFASRIWNATNIININIPRRQRVVWYENMQPQESFTSIYFDSGDNYGEGLDEEEINDIPVHRYRPSSYQQGAQTTTKSCAVCISDFRSGQTIKTLQCLHSYHQQCIDKWLQLKGTCPVCRNDLH